MFPPAHSVKVYIATGITDMRKSINGLSILVADQLELDPLSGHLFAFCNRKRDIIKILYWDRNGFCLWMKRLESQTYRWPDENAASVSISNRELSWLLDGLDIRQKRAHRSLHYSIVS